MAGYKGVPNRALSKVRQGQRALHHCELLMAVEPFCAALRSHLEHSLCRTRQLGTGCENQFEQQLFGSYSV